MRTAAVPVTVAAASTEAPEAVAHLRYSRGSALKVRQYCSFNFDSDA